MVSFRIFGVAFFIAFFQVLTAQIIQNVQLLGSIDLTSYSPGNSIGNVTGFVKNGKEFAIVSITDGGLAIVDVSDPAHMTVASFISIPSGADRLYYAEYYSKGYIYATMRPGPLQIVNVQDPYNAFEVGTYSQNFSQAYRPWVDELRNRLYLVDVDGNPDGNNLIILDISSPENPVEIGAYSRTYHHIYVRNDTCYGFGFGADVDILNVSDPANITLIKQFVPGLPQTHSGWLHDNGRYLTVDHEYAPGEGPDDNGGYLQIFDLQPLPNDPSLAGTYATATNNTGEASLHHSYWYFNLIYMAYWTEGVRIVDAADPSSPVEVGVYDWEDPNVSGIYRGAWGIYPFLPSRNLLVSKRKEGLYVFDFLNDGPGIYYQAPDTTQLSSPQFTGQFKWITGDSIIAEQSVVYWRTNRSGGWNTASVSFQQDSMYSFSIPVAEHTPWIEYYIETTDNQGRRSRAPGKAPYLDWYKTYLEWDQALKVNLSHFSAKTVNSHQVIITWTTQSEVNNEGFVLWRKGDGDTIFSKLASYDNNKELRGQGTSTVPHTYHFVDSAPPAGKVHYLLQSVSFDGKVENFGPVAVTVTNALPEYFSLQAFPNPFNGTVHIRVSVPRHLMGKTITMTIYNIGGQKIKTLLEHHPVENSLILATWAGIDEANAPVVSGVYFLVSNIGESWHIRKLLLLR